MPLPTVTPTPAEGATCPTAGYECEPDCFQVVCKDTRRHYKKCLSKGFEWFEARDYANPGNVAGCMIHKTRYGVGGCYELICVDHDTQDECEGNESFWCPPTQAPTVQPSLVPGPARTGARTPTDPLPPTPSRFDTRVRLLSPLFRRAYASCVSPRRNVPNRATWMFSPSTAT